ncbi:MAG: PorP/SprF family type IX secretion system membrane protein [Bacteroidota bacterium]
MKKLYFAFALLFPFTLAAQQLPDGTPFQENQFIWNPAMTAVYDYWELGATYRQQWLGFNDAPTTATMQVQYPFRRKKFSLGGYFMFDDVGPVRYTSLAFSYAYKFSPRFRKYDQLSIGFMGILNQFFVDGLEVEVNDQDDAFIPRNESSGFSPNASVGVFYTSYGREDRKKDYFYAGIAANQLIPSNLTLEQAQGSSDANFQRAIHANAIVGYRFIEDELFIEPMLWVNYAMANLVNGYIGIRLEQYKAFWGGLTYSSNQTVGIQAGYILPEIWNKDDAVRIGLNGTYNIGNFGNYRSVGFEFYTAYRFEL